jgi:hypothetical protein
MNQTTPTKPKMDATWYIKWGSSIILLMAVVIRATGLPHLMWLDLIGSLIGSIGWLIVALIWKDRALILLNLVVAAVLLVGIFKWIYVN